MKSVCFPFTDPGLCINTGPFFSTCTQNGQLADCVTDKSIVEAKSSTIKQYHMRGSAVVLNISTAVIQSQARITAVLIQGNNNKRQQIMICLFI